MRLRETHRDMRVRETQRHEIERHRDMRLRETQRHEIERDTET